MPTRDEAQATTARAAPVTRGRLLTQHTGLPPRGTAAGKPAPPEMADWAKKALYASRINFMLSIPMLFCMVAQQNGGL